MVGFPTDPDQMYAVMRRELLRDSESQTMAMPAEYMFHDVPEKEIDRQTDHVALTIAAMDQHGLGVGPVSVSPAPAVAARAPRDHPDRFVALPAAEPLGRAYSKDRLRHSGENLVVPESFNNNNTNHNNI